MADFTDEGQQDGSIGGGTSPKEQQAIEQSKESAKVINGSEELQSLLETQANANSSNQNAVLEAIVPSAEDEYSCTGRQE